MSLKTYCGEGAFSGWEKGFEPLAPNFTLYALDMPGHGDSDKPSPNYLSLLQKSLNDPSPSPPPVKG